MLLSLTVNEREENGRNTKNIGLLFSSCATVSWKIIELMAFFPRLQNLHCLFMLREGKKRFWSIIVICFLKTGILMKSPLQSTRGDSGNYLSLICSITLDAAGVTRENPTGIPYDGIYGEAPPERGTFSGFRYMKGYSDFRSRSILMGREICYCGLWKNLKGLLSFQARI